MDVVIELITFAFILSLSQPFNFFKKWLIILYSISLLGRMEFPAKGPNRTGPALCW